MLFMKYKISYVCKACTDIRNYHFQPSYDSSLSKIVVNEGLVIR